MTGMLISLINLVAFAVWILVLARVLMSWLAPQHQHHPAAQWITRATEPMLRPFRSLLPPWKTGGLDLSPMILLLVIWIVQRILISILRPMLVVRIG